ncbi:MAG: thiamine pyrophosphate-requiring protein [Rhodobiaceae bacterium]|nr:thiamine pyrophosphate-requiring protein [Rhodobiaceae bacterium]
MSKMPVPQTSAEALLCAMKSGGVDYLFANAGTDFPPVIEAYARAEKTALEMPAPLVVPHENVAVGMAHGHYLVSGHTQAVMVHVNVGLANTAMAVINAASDNVPVLLCSGRTPATEKGRLGSRNRPIHWGQEMRDQGALVRESVKWDHELRYGEQAGPLAARALAVANSAPPGPVYLSLPREALAEALPGSAGPVAAMAASAAGPTDQAAIEAAADMLAGARKPLIIAHRVASDQAWSALADLAARFAIPVIEYWATRNTLSTEHPFFAGREPGPWLAEADVVVALDAMVPWVPQLEAPAPGAKVIGIGHDPLFARIPVREFAVDANLAGEPALALGALAAALDRRGLADSAATAERRARVAERIGAQREKAEAAIAAPGTGPMSPAYVSRCISDAKAEDAILFNELACILPVMRFTRPKTLFGNILAGGLGWGLPAALGAKLAVPERDVIACIGDGSYIFANPVACHQTAAMHDIPVLTIVFNNAVWNAVRRATTYMYPQGEAVRANVMPMTSLGAPPDYAAIARAHGAFAEQVSAAADLPGALERALHATRHERRQALLDVAVSY